MEPGPSPVRPGARVVYALIGVNIACYILQVVVFRQSGGLIRQFGLWPQEVRSRFAIWQLVTSLFLHDPSSPLHIFFNMFVLYAFGPAVAARMGRTRFLLFYLVAGVAASATYVLLGPLTGLLRVAVGASGAILGLLVYYTFLNPDAPVLLFFLIPMRMKWATVLIIGVDVVAFTTGTSDQIAHTAHLGGALAGLAWYFAERHRAARKRRGPPPPRAEREADPSLLEEVDRLLDKIREGGLDSLSEKERRFLREASRRIRS
jgi:membrane associated rhomboid family serine protease